MGSVFGFLRVGFSLLLESTKVPFLFETFHSRLRSRWAERKWELRGWGFVIPTSGGLLKMTDGFESQFGEILQSPVLSALQSKLLSILQGQISSMSVEQRLIQESSRSLSL